MKRLLVATVFMLAMAFAAYAQEETSQPQPTGGNAAASFANAPAANPIFPQAARTTLGQLSVWDASRAGVSPSDFGASAMPSPSAQPTASWTLAEPAPSAPPAPRFIFGGRDDFRFQLALGISLIRFRSSVYYATAIGTNTSLTYFTNQSFGIEGRIMTAFAPTIYVNEHVKYLSYGAGPKLAWRRPHWEPWVHAIVGGAHVLPQTALGGKNAFAFQGGGGLDYRLNPRLSLRAEVDWVRTHFWGQWQDSGQAAIDGVIHF